MSDVFIVAAARAAVGGFGGSLKSLPPVDLATQVVQETIGRSGLSADAVEHTVFGNVIHTEMRDPYISRVVAMNAGVPKTSPALTVNRLCGSGLQAIVSAAQLIQLGDAGITLAGGVESMSNAGYLAPAMRWGQKMGDATMLDMLTGALSDPFGNGHMGITAENISERYDISREQQDAFAVESHKRAHAAIEAGYFVDQIVPIEIKSRKGSVTFAQDEHVRADANLETMAGLRAVFKKDGVVTAGNSSGINDGASALILSNEANVASHALQPLARIVSYGFGGVAPDEMGMGPVPACEMALKKASLKVADIALVESNEAFAAQACAVSKVLGLDDAIVNPNGGAVALGHPVGATGAIIMTKLVHELRRRGDRYGMATMCIGGGQGITVIIENVDAK